MLGYYAHLITDAAFQAMTLNEDRVKAAWSCVQADALLCKASVGMEETWDSIKKLISKRNQMRDIYAMEAEYLREHLDSGYFTEILSLKEFPDYINYLPKKSIVHKIGVMGYLPKLDESLTKFAAVLREKYVAFVGDTIQLVVKKFADKKLIQNPQIDTNSL